MESMHAKRSPVNVINPLKFEWDAARGLKEDTGETETFIRHPRLLVALPCLNEAATVGHVIARIPRGIQGIDHIDVLVVDDGSTDLTVKVAKQAGAHVISHGANRGVGAAFQTAVNYAAAEGYDFMVNMDADGQFNPEDITLLVAPVLASQADMVTGSRFTDPLLTPDMPRIKLVGNYMMSWLISQLVRQRYADVSCGFRCYSREALLRLNLHGAFTYTQETFLDFTSKNLRIVEVPVRVHYFSDRESRVAGSILKYAQNTLKIIFRGYRDYFALRFFLGIAALIAFPGTMLGCIFVGHFLLTGHFSGFLFAGFASGFLIAVALIFVVLAVVTDMLDRIRVNQERILYLLKKTQLPPIKQSSIDVMKVAQA